MCTEPHHRIVLMATPQVDCWVDAPAGEVNPLALSRPPVPALIPAVLVAGYQVVVGKAWVFAPRQWYGLFGANFRKVKPTLKGTETSALVCATAGKDKTANSCNHDINIAARRITLKPHLSILGKCLAPDRKPWSVDCLGTEPLDRRRIGCWSPTIKPSPTMSALEI
jgi:hypothetical protein